MRLRPELTPPELDDTLVARLAVLADRLDGARPGQRDEDLAEFGSLSGMAVPLADFQGIYKAEDAEDWVRRLLYGRLIGPAGEVSPAELVEVVRRAIPTTANLDLYEAYMAIFDANVPLEGASNLIFYPPDYDPSSNTWGGGRPMSEYYPTPEQIVEWSLGHEIGRRQD